MPRDRLAWNVYWLSFALFVILFGAYAALSGSGTVWGIAVAIPLVIGGLDLMLFRASHERICSIEVARHAWLRILTMGGYDRWTFFATGAAEIALAAFIAGWIAAR